MKDYIRLNIEAVSKGVLFRKPSLRSIPPINPRPSSHLQAAIAAARIKPPSSFLPKPQPKPKPKIQVRPQSPLPKTPSSVRLVPPAVLPRRSAAPPQKFPIIASSRSTRPGSALPSARPSGRRPPEEGEGRYEEGNTTQEVLTRALLGERLRLQRPISREDAAKLIFRIYVFWVFYCCISYTQLLMYK